MCNAADIVTNDNAFAALQMSLIPFDPSYNRGDLDSLRQLMELSFATSLASAPFPFRSIYPPLNSSPFSVLAEPQPQLPYHINTAPQSVAFRGSTLGPPSFLQSDPLASLTMSNRHAGNLFASLFDPPLVMSPPVSALMQSLMPHSTIQRSFPPSISAASVRQEHDGSISSTRRLANSRHTAPTSSRSQSSRNHGINDRSQMTIHRFDAGVILFQSDDHGKLNDHQIFLRQQIEYFRATQEDIMSHTRGKNKPIVLHQVGVRCRHCNHIPVGRRQKGSTYFPSNLMGIYQAAQNLSVEHLQSGICTETPADIKKQFLSFASTKPAASGAGKKYWAEAGSMLGLVDTEDGILFADDVEQ
jgi:hypothetical protein